MVCSSHQWHWDNQPTAWFILSMQCMIHSSHQWHWDNQPTTSFLLSMQCMIRSSHQWHWDNRPTTSLLASVIFKVSSTLFHLELSDTDVNLPTASLYLLSDRSDTGYKGTPSLALHPHPPSSPLATQSNNGKGGRSLVTTQMTWIWRFILGSS